MAIPYGRGMSGTKEIGNGLVAVPTSATDLTTTDTWINQIILVNTTAGALTVTINDKQGSPLALVPTVSLAANTLYITVFPFAVKMTSGISWSASGAGINAEIFGYKV